MTEPAKGPRSTPGGSLLLPSAADSAVSLVAGRTAGAAHEKLGVFGEQQFGALGSKYYQQLSQGRTEEERRQLLLTGERHRRGAHLRYVPTDTLGLQEQQEQQSAAAAAGWYYHQQQQATLPATLGQQGSNFGTRFAREGPQGCVPMVAAATSPEHSAAALAAIYLATHKQLKGSAPMR